MNNLTTKTTQQCILFTALGNSDRRETRWEKPLTTSAHNNQPRKNPEEKQNKEKPAGKKPSTALFYYHNTQAHMSLKAGPTRHFVNISTILLSVGSHAMWIVPAATASHT
jgi:hypothetical protein